MGSFQFRAGNVVLTGSPHIIGHEGEQYGNDLQFTTKKETPDRRM